MFTTTYYGWDRIVELSGMEADTLRLLLLVAIPFVIVQAILFFAGLFSIIKKETVAMDKLPWLILLFVNIIGPIIYFAVGSNMLDQKIADREEGENRYE